MNQSKKQSKNLRSKKRKRKSARAQCQKNELAKRSKVSAGALDKTQSRPPRCPTCDNSASRKCTAPGGPYCRLHCPGNCNMSRHTRMSDRRMAMKNNNSNNNNDKTSNANGDVTSPKLRCAASPPPHTTTTTTAETKRPCDNANASRLDTAERAHGALQHEFDSQVEVALEKHVGECAWYESVSLG